MKKEQLLFAMTVENLGGCLCSGLFKLSHVAEMVLDAFRAMYVSMCTHVRGTERLSLALVVKE